MPPVRSTAKPANAATAAALKVQKAAEALHAAIDPADQHNLGLAAALGSLAETVASVIMARQLAEGAAPRLRKSKGQGASR